MDRMEPAGDRQRTTTRMRYAVLAPRTCPEGVVAGGLSTLARVPHRQ